MASKRTPRIVVLDEDLSAAEAGMEQVTSVRSDVSALESVSTLMGTGDIDETAALTTEEIGTVTVDLTDKEASDLSKRKGVAAVEEDVWAHVSETGDEESHPDDVADEDPEASEEVDAAQMDIENGEIATDEQLLIAAERASQVIPEFDDEIDFDEAGQVFALSAVGDPIVASTGDAAGIPKEKLAALIRCIIKCALTQLTDNQATDVSEEMINKLLVRNGVALDSEAARAIRDYITCGLRIIYVPYAWRYSTGAGARVAVVDTGIAPRHPDLRVYGGASFVPGVRSWADDHGHGTHVAGTIAALRNNRGVVGVGPHARLYGVKVLNRQGSGRSSWILGGLVWCYRARMHIANLSLGSRSNTHDPRQYSRAYERAGRLMRSRGILAVAAAGNNNGPVGNPARCPSFMAVSAVDCKRRRAPFSCFGPQVEVTAPGVNVWSTYPPNTYRRLSGTSMASPHVAGVAALIKRRHPSWHGDRIRVHMWRTASDLAPTGRDIAFGFGLVNAYRAVR